MPMSKNIWERGSCFFDLTKEIERRLVYIEKCATCKDRCKDFRVGIYMTSVSLILKYMSHSVLLLTEDFISMSLKNLRKENNHSQYSSFCHYLRLQFVTQKLLNTI